MPSTRECAGILLEVGIATSVLLEKYVEIENQVLARKFSLLHVLPIPGIFKAIDYSKPTNELDQIIKLIEEKINTVNKSSGICDHPICIEFNQCYDIYASSLLEAVKLLRQITYKLWQKADAIAPYSYHEYNNDLEYYDRSRQKYICYGDTLNKSFAKLKGLQILQTKQG